MAANWSPTRPPRTLRPAEYNSAGGGGCRGGYFIGQEAYWSPPEWGSREDRALRRLSFAEAPAGVVVPSDLWRAAALESGLTVPAIKRLARRAAAGGDSRIAWFAAHLERLRRRTPRGPGDLSRARKAHRLRQRGLPWKQIARLCGYSEADNGYSAREAAANYQARLADGGTLRRGRMAYRRRERGEAWQQIAHRVGYSSARSARAMARRYAERAGLPWPVPVRDASGAD